jgi:hypothetical protein
MWYLMEKTERNWNIGWQARKIAQNSHPISQVLRDVGGYVLCKKYVLERGSKMGM